MVPYLCHDFDRIVHHGERLCPLYHPVQDRSRRGVWYIHVDLNRGGTFLKGEGMFAGGEKTIIYTNVNRRELAILQEYIHEIDPRAFMTVINANEVLGRGFRSLREKVTE